MYLEGGKPEVHGLPQDANLHQPFTIGSSGRLFFSLEDCVTQPNKGDNEYTKLNQFSICNHWHHPPFFRLEGQALRKMGGRPPFRMYSDFPHQIYHKIVFFSIKKAGMKGEVLPAERVSGHVNKYSRNPGLTNTYYY